MKLPALLALAILSAGLVAQADTISTFDLSGDFYIVGGPSNPPPAGDISGTVTIDTTTGIALSADVFALQGFGSVQSQIFGGTSVLVFDGGASRLALVFPDLPSFVGYTGGSADLSLLEDYQPYAGDYSGVVDLSLAGAAAPTVTPEPSSMALLATGALGIVWLGRRRLANVKACLNHQAGS